MAQGENCQGCSQSGSCSSQQQQECSQEQQLQECLAGIKNKILVLSGKGGVGKSSTAVNLALALAREGQKVGLLDVDLHGPSIPGMLGLEEARPEVAGEKMQPVTYDKIGVASIGFLLQQPTDALIWRGPMKANVIRQLLADVAWGDLDYLVVDCPPGTGDEPLSIAQYLGQDTAAVIVTTPQQVALADVRKTVTFCHKLELKIHGVLENMSGFVCPSCGEVAQIFSSGGGQRLAAETGIPLLGKVPLDPSIVSLADQGRPCVVGAPESPATQVFRDIAASLICEGQAAQTAN